LPKHSSGKTPFPKVYTEKAGGSFTGNFPLHDQVQKEPFTPPNKLRVSIAAVGDGLFA
jgi:hypothetical protein